VSLALRGVALAMVLSLVGVAAVTVPKTARLKPTHGAISALMLTVAGITVFSERLSASEIAGIGMAVAAMLLLGRATG
jgi:multidrug transporter EmrE-like cation transporter